MPVSAAESIRRIGSRRPSASPRGFICRPCSASWSGPEADCFNCGNPATQEQSTPASALQVLLRAAGRKPSTTVPALSGVTTDGGA